MNPTLFRTIFDRTIALVTIYLGHIENETDGDHDTASMLSDEAANILDDCQAEGLLSHMLGSAAGLVESMSSVVNHDSTLDAFVSIVTRNGHDPFSPAGLHAMKLLTRMHDVSDHPYARMVRSNALGEISNDETREAIAMLVETAAADIAWLAAENETPVLDILPVIFPALTDDRFEDILEELDLS